MTTEYEYYLTHMGVKGMRWGFRKKRMKPPSPRQIRKAHKKTKRIIRAATLITLAASISLGVALSKERGNQSRTRDFIDGMKAQKFDRNVQTIRKDAQSLGKILKKHL